MVTVQDVKERWEKIQGDDERILFIVGGPGSAQTIHELANFYQNLDHQR